MNSVEETVRANFNNFRKSPRLPKIDDEKMGLDNTLMSASVDVQQKTPGGRNKVLTKISRKSQRNINQGEGWVVDDEEEDEEDHLTHRPKHEVPVAPVELPPEPQIAKDTLADESTLIVMQADKNLLAAGSSLQTHEDPIL